MALHLPGKVARLIGDFRTIHALVDLIDHRLEKRMVARHGWVKLDSVLALGSRLKNRIRDSLPPHEKHRVEPLEALLSRLRNDVSTGPIATVRDAMCAHALKLDLVKIDEAWQFMCADTYAILNDDLDAIDAELGRLLGGSHISAGSAQVAVEWREVWRHPDYLGDPSVPRAMTAYSVLGTGVLGPLPGGHPAQDALIRIWGVANYLIQERKLLQATPRGSEAERLFAEMMVNDYFALWEMLFQSHVRNDYGPPDRCLLSYWEDPAEPWGGRGCLKLLEGDRHAQFEVWRQEVRNRTTAHLDADVEIWRVDIGNWPMTVDELINEAGRVVRRLWECVRQDIRSRAIVFPPTPLEGVLALSGQEGRGWSADDDKP